MTTALLPASGTSGRTPLIVGLLMMLVVLAPPAWAHKASDSFVYLTDNGQNLRIDVALRDLALLVPLDADGDRQVTGAELRAARAELTLTVESGVTTSASGEPCRLEGKTWGVSEHSDGFYAASQYRVRCPDGTAPDQLRYTLLFDVDPLHRALVSLGSEDSERLTVIGPDTGSLDLAAPAPSAWHTFFLFIRQGIWHLLMGLDHLLFLLVLAIPATLGRAAGAPDRHRGAGITASSGLKQRLRSLAGIVTAFTIAHSITLALSALHLVTLPSAWVETVIALSIAVTAVNVIWPILGRRTWLLAFGFGLVHGFGFASVLADLTSGTGQLAVALAGFNLGVEVGQLGLLAIGFPILYWLSQRPMYERRLVPALLILVGITSLMWVGQRMPV